MYGRSPASLASASMNPHDKIKKRVCKACDRCRLKKLKCDGSSPCSRCITLDTICVFGERKKSKDKVFPKGYTEILESQQNQLIAGLRELYKRLKTGQGWPGQPLQERQSGHPLTHDILERLDLLHSSGNTNSSHEIFQGEWISTPQHALTKEPSSTRRRGSVKSLSECGCKTPTSSHGAVPAASLFALRDSIAYNSSTPAPPMSTHVLVQAKTISAIEQHSPVVSSISVNAGVLNHSLLPHAPRLDRFVIMDGHLEISEPTYGLESLNNLEQNGMGETMVTDHNHSIWSDWLDLI